jgi:hypothetical protein
MDEAFLPLIVHCGRHLHIMNYRPQHDRDRGRDSLPWRRRAVTSVSPLATRGPLVS